MKTIDTLVQDMNQVILDGGGWDETITKFATKEFSSVVKSRLSNERDEYEGGNLRLSALGNPCPRQLWYKINTPNESKALSPSTKLKFFYGDLLEILLISLAKAAGHRVEGLQTALEVVGIRGHRDCVIDGITVDVKSASTFGFEKFAKGDLRSNDPFGYISQLSSYVYAGRSDTTVDTDPNVGAFLVVDKQHGTICLDKYDFSLELDNKEEEVRNIKTYTSSPMPPDRRPDVVETHYKKPTGNRKLDTVCGYCGFLSKCHPDVQTYIHSGKPIFYTKIEGKPKGRKARETKVG